nr:spore coat protein [Tepidanaerobacter acetatoxydans]
MVNQTQNKNIAGTNIDKDILNDMLMTEKYVSGTYETAVMEAANETVRDTLRQIQDEEQQHAKMIFDAMNQRGWYTPQ